MSECKKEHEDTQTSSNFNMSEYF